MSDRPADGRDAFENCSYLCNVHPIDEWSSLLNVTILQTRMGPTPNPPVRPTRTICPAVLGNSWTDCIEFVVWLGSH